MGKSMYSLMLSDEIVAAIDRLAAREGWSRSAFVNHILAEYASLSTPEMRLRGILDAVAGGVDGGLRSTLSSGGTLTLRTSLQYKYNPQLNYLLELYGEEDDLGELRVTLRSQNEGLLGSVRQFFELWCELERQHLPKAPDAAAQSVEQKRYRRRLRRPAVALSGEELGSSIAAYVGLMNSCLQAYLTCPGGALTPGEQMERQYLRALRGIGPAAEL